jgi:3-oxoadipate enol-lactonase
MPYAVNRGIRLYWEEYGSGSPVLLIMGLSFTHEMWFRVLPLLTSEHRVIVFDNRGMGRSDVPRGLCSIPQMAADAHAVLDAAGTTEADVIGASMGGMIAQELALRFPECVRRLVLACTTHGGLFARWPDFRGYARRNGRSGAGGLERALIPLLYSGTTSSERIDEDLKIRSGCRWCYRGFVGQLAGILAWSSYRRLAQMNVPTLVIHGEQDRLVPPQNGKAVANRIPSAQFRLVPQAGHMLVTDQPDLCAEIVLGFLGRQEVSEDRGYAARSV